MLLAAGAVRLFVFFQLHFYSTLVPSGDAQIADYSADASLEEGASPMSKGGAFGVGGGSEDVVRVLRTYGPHGQTVPAKTSAKVHHRISSNRGAKAAFCPPFYRKKYGNVTPCTLCVYVFDAAPG